MKQHVVTKPKAPFTSQSGKLEVHQVPAWEDNLVWLIRYDDAGHCAAVDGPEPGPILDYCQRHGLTLTTILNTHTHGDHVGINRGLDRLGHLAAMRVVGPAKVSEAVPGITERVSEGDTVVLGDVQGKVMLTEGHINGHISFVFEDLLFCGDTLFGAGCGYLFDGPPEAMYESLSRLGQLPGDTKVCCAHEYTEDNLRFAWSVEPGNTDLAERIDRVWHVREAGESSVPSTIAEEVATNPFLRQHSKPLRERVAAGLGISAQSSDKDIFAATRQLKDKKAYRDGMNPPFPR